MSSQEDGAAEQDPETKLSDSTSTETDATGGAIITVTIGATVPTGFEHTAAEEVKEKIGVDVRISKDRGRIYFPITTDKLFQVHLLRSVDNLFVVVEEYDHYQFKESKEETLAELQELASKLPWTNALEVWKLNGTLKKRKVHRRGGNVTKVKPNSETIDATVADTEEQELPEAGEGQTKAETTPDMEASMQDSEDTAPKAKVIKFRVTCNRAGDKHSFSSNEAARDFGGAVQEFFQWKADMTKFDIEGAIEFPSSFYIAGDNNDMAVNRTVNNTRHIQKRRADMGSVSGLPIDTVRWDLCNLPIKTSSVDIIITDMPFGKRMGSKKKNWDLYPSCLREMARVCRPGSGKAVLLTQDKKCFAKALSRMGGLWRKMHTVWVNVGGLHAGVYLLKRTGAVFGQTPEDVYESRGTVHTHEKGDKKDDEELS
eukprot:superscaffoldBa00000500_g5229